MHPSQIEKTEATQEKFPLKAIVSDYADKYELRRNNSDLLNWYPKFLSEQNKAAKAIQAMPDKQAIYTIGAAVSATRTSFSSKVLLFLAGAATFAVIEKCSSDTPAQTSQGSAVTKTVKYVPK